MLEETMQNPYRELAITLRALGAKPYMNRRQQMVVGREIPVLPTSGMSFWVTHSEGVWHVGTWGGNVYRVKVNTSMPMLCMALLSIDQQVVSSDLPANVVAEYGLTLLSEQQDECLFQVMRAAAESEPPETTYEQFISEVSNRDLRVIENGKGAVLVRSNETDTEERFLWFCLYRNHWYVRTPARRIYALDDTEVMGLCIYGLQDEEPVVDVFSDQMIEGYGMFEVSQELRCRLTDQFSFD